MAIYKVEGPDGHILHIEGPDNASEQTVLQQAQLLYTQQQEREAKQGFIPAVKSRFVGGKGAAERGIGTILEAAGAHGYAQPWLEKAKAAQEEAASIAVSTSDEDVRRAEEENGLLGLLGARYTQYISEPLGGMIGRLAPTAAMSAMGPLGLGAALTNEYLASVGEAKERGAEDTSALLYGAPLAALNVGRLPTGPLAGKLAAGAEKVFGAPATKVAEKGVREAGEHAATEEAARLAEQEATQAIYPMTALEEAQRAARPYEVGATAAQEAAGRLASERTKAQLARDVAAGTAGNIGVAVPGALAQEAMLRASAGQEQQTPEEMLDTAGHMAALAPIFGAGHAYLRNPVLEAKKAGQAEANRIASGENISKAREAVEAARTAQEVETEPQVRGKEPAPVQEPKMARDEWDSHTEDMAQRHFEDQFPDLDYNHMPRDVQNAWIDAYSPRKADKKVRTQSTLDAFVPDEKATETAKAKVDEHLEQQEITRKNIGEQNKARQEMQDRLTSEWGKLYPDVKFDELSSGQQKQFATALGEGKHIRTTSATGEVAPSKSSARIYNSILKTREEEAKANLSPMERARQDAQEQYNALATERNLPDFDTLHPEAQQEIYKAYDAESGGVEKVTPSQARAAADLHKALTEETQPKIEEPVAQETSVTQETEAPTVETPKKPAGAELLNPEDLDVYNKGTGDKISEAEAAAHIKEPEAETPVEPTKPAEPAAPTPLYAWKFFDPDHLEDFRKDYRDQMDETDPAQVTELRAIDTRLRELRGSKLTGQEKAGKTVSQEAREQEQFEQKQFEVKKKVKEHNETEAPTHEQTEDTISAVNDAQAFRNKLEQKSEPAGTHKSHEEIGKGLEAAYNADLAHSISRTHELSNTLKDSSNPIIRHIAASVSKALQFTKTFKVSGEERSHYDPKTDTVYLHEKDLSNQYVVAHELMHAILHKALHAKADDLSLKQIEHIKELNDLYKRVKKDSTFKGEHGITNIDEFLAEGLTNPDFQYKLSKIKEEGKSLWGKFVDSISKILGFDSPNALQTFLHHASSLIETNLPQGKRTRAGKLYAPDTAKRLLDTGYTRMGKESEKATPAEITKGFVHNWLDKWSKLETTLSKTLNTVLANGKLRADQLGHAYAQMNNTLGAVYKAGGMEISKSGEVIAKDLPYARYDGKVVNASFPEMQKLVDEVPNGRELFNTMAYVLDTRAQLKRDPDKVGSHVKDDMAKFEQAEKDVAALRAQYPQLNDALGMWRQINSNTINAFYNSGIITAKLRDIFHKEADYFPRYMIREDLMDMLGADKGEPVQIGNTHTKVFRERTPSEHQVNVWENMARHIANATSTIAANELKKTMAEQLVATENAVEVKPTKFKGAQGNFATMENGERKYYKLDDPSIIPTLMIANQQLGSFMKMAKGATNVLRTGVLYTPPYWVRQIVRDPIAASLSHNYGWITPFHTMAELSRIVKGDSPIFNKLAKAGVIGHVDPSINIHDMVKTLGRPLSEQSRLSQTASQIARRAEFIHVAIDGATRVAVYKRAHELAIKAGKSEEVANIEGIHAAREAINFAITGDAQAAQSARQLVPFLGAGINGLRLLQKAMTAQHIKESERAEFRKQFIKKAALVGMVSGAYAMMMAGNKEYEDVNDQRKYNNWLVPTGDKEHPFLNVALPPEYAFMKWLPEMLVRYSMGTKDGMDILKDVAEQTKAMLPGGMGYTGVPLPQFIRPALETFVYGVSSYTGEPVESASESQRPVMYRGEHGASETAKFVSSHGGALAKISPAKFDAFVRGTAGELGTAVVSMIDQFIPTSPVYEKQEKDVSQIPGLGLKGLIGSRYESQTRTGFYEHRNDADQWRSEINRRMKEGRADDVRELAKDPEVIKKYEVAKHMDKIASQLSTLNGYIKAIEANKNMPQAEREAKIDKLKLTINELARKGEELWKKVM